MGSSGRRAGRNLGAKMAEFIADAPLAQCETDPDDWQDFADHHQTHSVNTSHQSSHDSHGGDDEPCNDEESDSFAETLSESLEDLVNTFDEKITKCFCNYSENVSKMAPVQVRSQEEIMNDCQMWWTITGNFGNILPIDWTKSYARKLHLPALNLNEKGNPSPEASPSDDALTSEDEAVALDLDMHALIINGFQPEPIKGADEVIKEIDDLMKESHCSEESGVGSESPDPMDMRKDSLSSPLYKDKLEGLSMSQLNELYAELEMMIKEYSETLIDQLALRDELEFEKEIKNQFISLLLSIQNKKRQANTEKRKSRSKSISDAKYLTTVIPYHMEDGVPDLGTLQVLIKILKAVNDDSPTVPTLLTDYILKVLCPS
ncbi:unnamed protein product [Darwinula stevensoni]|uniref:Fasciculation and elongation protein zeta-2 n=1 Tax=Darwinula stevensoni TaxID=69355 RepID=A0A7R9A1V8_9CRUS|nr:unnamed protein product [Darwinula stevensoni]CAG0878649.1 unnamed protein product [Darwinula stevensoni]